MEPHITYETIKTMARELGVKTGELIALTANYDPFYVGRASDIRKAEWAKGIWDWTLERWEKKKEDLIALGYDVGVTPHLRGIHYLYFTGHPNPKLPSGGPYLGTDKDWETLLESFVKAKILRLVPFGQMVDRKHPHVVENLLRDGDQNISLPGGFVQRDLKLGDVAFYLSPELDDVARLKIEEMPRKSITARLPYHVEIWDEKGIRLVHQIASRFYANVQDSAGEQTYEPVYAFLKRAKERSEGKPVRAFYVSDYDPRGEYTIPVSVARKIELYIANLEEFKGLDIRLKKIVLTREQVKRLRLPPAPVKATEPMRRRWMERCGEDVVELEAIETLHPAEFVEIIEGELRRYYDEDAAKQIEEHNREVEEAISDYNERTRKTVRDAYRKFNEKIERNAKKALSGFKGRVKVDVQPDLEDIREIIDGWQEPEWRVDEEDGGWLYDSRRDYLTQLKHYKKVRGFC